MRQLIKAFQRFVNLQQTPKPAAQVPDAVPDFEEHSEVVIHVPEVVDEVVDVHSRFGNCTTENSENCSKKSIFIT